jgi:hypothetical protein
MVAAAPMAARPQSRETASKMATSGNPRDLDTSSIITESLKNL